MKILTSDEINTVKIGKILNLGKFIFDEKIDFDSIDTLSSRFFESGMQVATLPLHNEYDYHLPDYQKCVPENLEPFAAESSLLVFRNVEPHRDERVVYGKTHFFLLTLLKGAGTLSIYKNKKKTDSLFIEKGDVVLFNHLLTHEFKTHEESMAVAIVQPVIVPRRR